MREIPNENKATRMITNGKMYITELKDVPVIRKIAKSGTREKIK
jgi:hypothetical protein